MEYEHRELGQLIGLLEAQVAGDVIDPTECRRLALRVAVLYPDVANSMTMILGRIEASDVRGMPSP